MSDEEIESNNKLIVEFMGWKVIPTHSKELRYENLEGNHYYLHKLKFHNSYDWLMPVVECIENLNFQFWIGKYGTSIKSEKIGNFEVNIKEPKKLNAIYFAVIEFIKYYNKTKDERNRS
jgi:hypothetical protein